MVPQTFLKADIMANLLDSVVFKEVSSIIGKEAARNELNLVYGEYETVTEPDTIPDYLFNARLETAFIWARTPQGLVYWRDIMNEVESARYLDSNVNKYLSD